MVRLMQSTGKVKSASKDDLRPDIPCASIHPVLLFAARLQQPTTEEHGGDVRIAHVVFQCDVARRYRH